jgi:hypothetical protein
MTLVSADNLEKGSNISLFLKRTDR